MQILQLLESTNQFDRMFSQIASSVKGQTGVNISGKWLAGMMNQIKNFKFFDSMYNNYKSNDKDVEARDTRARIIARDMMEEMGLIAKQGGIYKFRNPALASQMRQYFTQGVHAFNDQNDVSKAARIANDAEAQEWIKSLSDEQKNWIANLQELTPEEMSSFKGILRLKEGKRAFYDAMIDWAENNDVAFSLFSNMGFIEDGSLNMVAVNQFRSFIDGLSDARIKDILSKSSVYTGKKITHDLHRAKNQVIKDIAGNKFGIYSKAIKAYNYISAELKNSNIADFKNSLMNLPVATDSQGNLNAIGDAALLLFKRFGGKFIDREDMEAAAKEIERLQDEGASGSRRAQKAFTRGENIRSQSEF